LGSDYLMLRNIWAIMATLIMISAAPAAGESINESSSLANTLTDVGITVPYVTAGTLALLGNERQKRAGRQTLDALLATSVVTQALKDITDASRPSDPEADDGFPSGHASINFAFARAIPAEYEQYQELAYLWATAVSWSRLRRNEHTFGQVAAGAALGWYIADRSIASKSGIFSRLFTTEHLTSPVNHLRCDSPADLKLPLWQVVW